MSDNHEEIAAIAHRIWEDEGRPENCAEDHWRRAEEEFVARQLAFPDNQVALAD